MEHIKNRIHISGPELTEIAQCPHSINYLDEINKHLFCIKCYALRKSAEYICLRAFRGGNQPSIATLNKKYISILINDGDFSISKAGTTSRLDEVILQDLVSIGHRHSSVIDLVGEDIVIHMGRFSLHDRISLVLCKDDTYTLVDFSCSIRHPCLELSYSTMLKSLWMRREYGIETNQIANIRLSPSKRPVLEAMELCIDTAIIHQAIIDAIDKVDIGPIKTPEELSIVEEARLDLPLIFGEHCMPCMKCFQ